MSTSNSSGRSEERNADNYTNASSVQLEERSDDEESAGSLCDFIVSSDPDDGELGPYDVLTDDDTVTSASTALAAELMSSLPFDASAGGTVIDSAGVRRSTRVRKAPVRYVDPHYAKMMLDDVSDMEDDESDSESNDGANCEMSTDEDYVAPVDVDDDELSDYGDEEDYADDEDGDEGDGAYDADTNESGMECDVDDIQEQGGGAFMFTTADGSGDARKSTSSAASKDVSDALAEWAS